jgi:hypothetical protein
MRGLLDRLARHGLLKTGVDPGDAGDRAPARADLDLLRLCERGALEGGLSVALDVRPDEAIGALCAAIGGGARRLRVVDVRERPVRELRVRVGEIEEAWDVEDVDALAHNLNDLLKDDPGARVVAVLGEWEDALQLWCVPKDKLAMLLRADDFAPRNRGQLESLAKS